MAKYEEQLARVKRYYERFKRLNDGKATEELSEADVDDVYAFFQNCYHLKDWLKNDPAYKSHTPQQIEGHVNSTPDLCICADICNGSKHLSLNRLRSGSEPVFGSRIESACEVIVPGRVVKRTFAMFIVVEHQGTRRDAFELATAALHSWETFIK